jgi:hypothetical protein|tara:strand:+ start:112 stop:999 length:888 start_codon:yes stop_codon:yes gene_type:complete
MEFLKKYGPQKLFGNKDANNGLSNYVPGASNSESESSIMKLAFLILVFFVFLLLFRVGLRIVTYFVAPSDSPYLVSGVADAKQMIEIPQDPGTKNAVTIKRSTNEEDGVEFTYSVWIYIDDLEYKKGQYRHIFHKGEESINFDDDNVGVGINYPNNAPGLYIAPNTNNLLVVMNTFQNIIEKVSINNVPLNKWVNVVIRCDNRTLDVYVNGSISRRHILSGLPHQNYGNVFVSLNGGFDGYTSRLRYYDYAIGTREIDKIIAIGPSTDIKTDDALQNQDYNYLSFKWYTTGQLAK